MTWLNKVQFNEDGLIPAIAQDRQSGKILMMAWMNKQALAHTVETKKATYWSRSRQALWLKGEQSGHEQIVHRILLDCDGDTLLLEVEQKGGIACHTGRESCFYLELQESSHGSNWSPNAPILKDPETIYKK